MKRNLFLYVLVGILTVLLAGGCVNEEQGGEKLCRIEITDVSENNCVTVLENQQQVDVSNFFDENNWTETEETINNMIPQYVISLYQEKTPVVLKQKNNEPYEKIMEYVTFENSDIVKISISVESINNIVSEEYLSEYYIGSEKFFSALSDLTET